MCYGTRVVSRLNEIGCDVRMIMHDFDVSVVTDDDRIDSIRVTAMSPVHAMQCGIILMGGAPGIYSVWWSNPYSDGMPVLERVVGK